MTEDIEGTPTYRFLIVSTTMRSALSPEALSVRQLFNDHNMPDVLAAYETRDDVMDCLPPGITEVTLSEGIALRRSPERIAQVPEANRISWNLDNVNAYCRDLARQIHFPWTPIEPHA